MAKKRILVLCPYPENLSPAQRLKYEQYFPTFREAGYEIVVSPFKSLRLAKIIHKRGHLVEKMFWTICGYLKRCWDLLRVWNFDIVYIFLWVTPFGPPFSERLLRMLNPRILYDIDDLVYRGQHTDKSWNVNWYIEFLKGTKKPLYLMGVARHVIVCTPTLEEFAKKYNKNVTDISSTINTATYQPVNHYQNDGVLTIGWSGSYSTALFLHLLDDVFRRISASRKVKILVMGDANFRIEGLDNVEAVAWSAEREVETLQRIDIGVYPLPLDDEWVLGKSGLKALQYMALGIPTIATGVGANFRVIEDNVSGLLVSSEDEWVAAIESLLENPSTRKYLGENGRKRVVSLYSIDANKHRYLEALENV